MVSRGIRMRGALVGVIAATVLASSACDSDGGGSGPAAPSSSSNESSASVAAGVEKDSVLDLNSTKDMTGVVTTVPIGKSPYDKNMPDICGFITQGAMGKLGVVAKQKGFYGSPLVYQSCILRPPPSFTVDFSISAEIYVNNLQEHLSVPNLKKVQPEPTKLFENVSAYKLRDSNVDGLTNLCQLAWGTFYGTAVVTLTDEKSSTNICERTLDAAKVLGPLMPKSPSQMRPTS